MTERTVAFERLRHQQDDPDPEYHWVVDVILIWLRDEDDLPRIEHGHGRTRDEACEMARHIAASFMAADDVAPDGWPDNGFDRIGPDHDNAPRGSMSLWDVIQALDGWGAVLTDDDDLRKGLAELRMDPEVMVPPEAGAFPEDASIGSIVTEIHDNELHFGRRVITGFIVIPEEGEVFFPHGDGFKIFLAGDATRIERDDGTVLWHAERPDNITTGGDEQ